MINSLEQKTCMHLNIFFKEKQKRTCKGIVTDISVLDKFFAGSEHRQIRKN